MVPIILVADTETTGLDPAVDRVVEYAHLPLILTALGEWVLGPYVTQVCDPQRDIPPHAKAVHHIVEEDVQGKPTVATFLGSLNLDLVTHLCFHNAEFDLGFIRDFLPKVPVIDTWRVSEHLMPDAPGHSNQVLRYWLGLKPLFTSTENSHPHRAGYDVGVTAAILLNFIGGLHDSTGSYEAALAELVRLSDPLLPILRREIRVGKHRGTPWEAIDAGYCKWILKQSGDNEFDLDTRHTAKYQLEWLHAVDDGRAAGKAWGTPL